MSLRIESPMSLYGIHWYEYCYVAYLVLANIHKYCYMIYFMLANTLFS